jgi:hypothetical protein
MADSLSSFDSFLRNRLLDALRPRENARLSIEEEKPSRAARIARIPYAANLKNVVSTPCHWFHLGKEVLEAFVIPKPVTWEYADNVRQRQRKVRFVIEEPPYDLLRDHVESFQIDLKR